ncbi:MAG: hypothetical protein JWN41_735 [Thermoleophilia bacterium]|nr:hypothetical protein [Thermoleophilia bacterium]
MYSRRSRRLPATLADVLIPAVCGVRCAVWARSLRSARRCGARDAGLANRVGDDLWLAHVGHIAIHRTRCTVG